MSKSRKPVFRRDQSAILAARLREPRRFLQIVTGPRQVGKTTLVEQVVADAGQASLFVSADEPTLRDAGWLAAQWDRARLLAHDQANGAILVIDEVQKIAGWSEAVKWHWDEDTRRDLDLRVVLLGSAPVLIRRGLSESLAGRFETVPLPHWSWPEMRAAFGFTLDDYLFFGGYPGAAGLVADVSRWRRYVLDALVETTIGRDILLLTRVDKPALLRRLFELGCRSSGQILSYTKMLGQLQDAGNTVTLAHYLDLLEGAGMACGLPKYMGQVVRQRASSPKLQVFNNALMGCHWVAQGVGLQAAQARPDVWGRLAESAVGTELLARHLTHSSRHPVIHYWNNGQKEVDYVLRDGQNLQALEVKSGHNMGNVSGLAAFMQQFEEAQPLLIGTGGMPLDLWLRD